MESEEKMANTEDLENALAATSTRINQLRQELQLFGRLGFSSEHVKFELRRLEKRQAKYEAALNERRSGNPKAVSLGFSQVEG